MRAWISAAGAIVVLGTFGTFGTFSTAAAGVTGGVRQVSQGDPFGVLGQRP